MQCPECGATHIGVWQRSRAIVSLSSKNFEQVIIVPSSSQAFVLDTKPGRLLLLQNTGCELSEEGKVFGGMATADATIVFLGSDI